MYTCVNNNNNNNGEELYAFFVDIKYLLVRDNKISEELYSEPQFL